MQKGLMELVFPIGSTYVTQVDTNPKDILEFGTWERLNGKVCVGLDEDDTDGYFNEIGKEGGEKKHTQTVNEMPSHTHGSNLWALKAGSGSQEFGSGGGQSTQITTSATGGGQPMNIIQPYRVVGYMWIRIA